jgi:hypothetical protein
MSELETKAIMAAILYTRPGRRHPATIEKCAALAATRAKAVYDAVLRSTSSSETRQRIEGEIFKASMETVRLSMAHPFNMGVGSGGDCLTCGLPDRDPIHKKEVR